MTYPSEEQKALWAAWVAERPESVRKVAQRLTPWNMYRMKTTGQIVGMLSFEEQSDDSVTVTVSIDPEDNPQSLMFFGRNVFGVDPKNLEFHAARAA